MISSIPFPKRMLKSELLVLVDDFIRLAQGKGKLIMSRDHPDVVRVYFHDKTYLLRYEDWLIVAPVVDSTCYADDATRDILLKFEKEKIKNSIVSLINASDALDYQIVE